MTLLQLIFGNALNLKQRIDHWADSGSIKEIYNVFYKAFFTSLSEIKKKSEGDQYACIHQLEGLLRLPNRRSDFFIFFEVEISNVSSFREFIERDDGLDKFAEVLISLVTKQEFNLDSNIAKAIIRKTLEDFQLNILNELSEGQFLAIILKQEFENYNLLEEIIGRLKIQEYQNRNLKKGQVHILDAINSRGQSQEKSLKHIAALLSSNEEDQEKRYFKKFLIPIYRTTLAEAKTLYKSKCPKKALIILNKLSNEDKYNEAPPSFRASVEIYKGLCQSSLGNYDEAARHHIEATHLKPDDITYLYNSVNAYLHLGETDKVGKIASKILSLDPKSTKGFALKLRNGPHKESLKEIISKIPKVYFDCTEVLYALSYVCSIKKNRSKQILYLKKACKNHPDNTEMRLYLAECLVSRHLDKYSSVTKPPLNKSAKKELVQARNIYLEIWEEFKDTELAKRHLNQIINACAVYSRLGETKKAIEVIDEGLQKFSDSALLKYYKVLFLCEIGKEHEAIKIASGSNLDEIPDFYIVLAELLHNSGRIEDAIAYLKEFSDKHSKSDRYEHGQCMLILYLINNDNIEEAKKALNGHQGLSLSPVMYAVIESKIIYKESGYEEHIKKLNEAYTLINETTLIEERFLLADSYYKAKKWYKARELYSKLIKTVESNPLVSYLTACYLNTTEWDKALKICKEIRDKAGFNPIFAEHELYALQMLKKYKEALAVCIEFRNLVPDNIYFQVLLAQLYIKLDQFENAAKVLAIIDYTKVTPRELEAIISNWIIIERVDAAIEFTYNYRRHHDTAFAHINYWKMGINYEKGVEDYYTLPNRVCKNTAVEIELENGVTDYFIIEDKEESQLKHNEINLNNNLYKKIKNKKIGDEFTWEETILGDKKALIKDIKTKWHYAFLDSLNLLETRFREEKPFQSFQFDTDDIDKLIDQQVEAQKQLKQFFTNIQPHYSNGLFPLGGIAEHLNRNPLEIFDRHKNNLTLGIKCSTGHDNLNQSVDLLQSVETVKIGADIFGLFSMYTLNLGEELVDCFGKLRITKSTLNNANNIFNQVNFAADKSSMSIIEENGERFRIESTVEEKSKVIAFYKGFLDWIDKFCTIALISTEEYNQQKDEDRKQLFGRSSTDTYYLVEQHNYILLSDDFAFRKVLENDHQIKGIWSQSILLYLAQNGKITTQTYHEKLIDLMLSNYHFIVFNPMTLLLASKRSVQVFERISMELGEKKCTFKSATACCIEFLIYLWSDQDLDYQYKKNVTGLALLGMTTDRNSLITLTLIYNNLSNPEFRHMINLFLLKSIREWAAVQCIYLPKYTSKF